MSEFDEGPSGTSEPEHLSDAIRLGGTPPQDESIGHREGPRLRTPLTDGEAAWQGPWKERPGRVLRGVDMQAVILLDCRAGSRWRWLHIPRGDHRSRVDEEGAEIELADVLVGYPELWEWALATHGRALFVAAHEMRTLNAIFAGGVGRGIERVNLLAAALTTEANVDQLIEQLNDALHSRGRP